MAPALLIFFLSPVWAAFSLPGMLATAAADAHGGPSCPPAPCGNVSIQFPFWIVPEHATETNCGELGFQVKCYNRIPYLGYHLNNFSFRIHDIFYHNTSLIVIDVHKIEDLTSPANASCHIPTYNSSTKLGLPFSISPLNQELVFYNCTEVPPRKVIKEGLVGPVCHNHNKSFVRAGGSYVEESGKDGSYFLEGCNSTVLPVLGDKPGMVDASKYLKLITNGFLLTWQTSSSWAPWPSPPAEEG